MNTTTQIHLNTNTATALREIAAAFEYYTTTDGDETGNTAAMLEQLAKRWRANPVETLAQLGPLVTQTQSNT